MGSGVAPASPGMRDALRHFVAECVGTFAVVFVAGGAIMMATQGAGNLLTVAAAYGLTYGIMVTATMRVSGHLNPAVTLGFLATRRIQPPMAGVYLMAQLIGAMVAAYAHRGLVPAAVFAAAQGGTQSIALAVNGPQAFGLEAIATFLLVFVVFGTAVDPQAPRIGGWAIGLAATAATLAIGPLTGGSLNPARSFGPAVATGIWQGQVIYWAGPILGAVLGALLYDGLFLPRAAETPGSGAVQPLKGKGVRRDRSV